MTDTRAYQPAGVGIQQSIHDIRWATRAFAAGVIPAATNFFGAAPNADLNVDRYEQGNSLVGSANEFTICAIGVQIQPGAAMTFADFESTVNLCSLRLVTAAKEYGVFPLFMLGAGGGVQASGGQIGTTPAAAPAGAASTPGLTNGIPDPRAQFVLTEPLTIQANQSFYAEMLAPTGGGVVPVITLTGALRVRVLLSGKILRAAA